MEKFKVSFEASNQQLKSIGTKHASDTYADIEATFVLGEKWTDMDSVSAVWWNDFVRVATVLDSQGKCIVPHEVLTRKGCVRVNLVGSIVEGDELITRLTSYSAEAVQVNEKIKLTGNEPQSITPSQYEQFVQNVKADADRAEAGADEAEQSAQSASESATASANSASESAQSATASAQSAQNASEIAVEVEVMKNEVELAKDKVLGMRATAETLEAGSDATASYSDGLLTLGIPRGDQGIQGIQGDTGATPNLTIGNVETLEPSESATATITGTAEEPVLNLGIPKGDTGEVSLEGLEALLPTDTASGDIVTIPDGQSVIPAESLKVELEPIQDLHGYDKPWSGGGGKNKLDQSAYTWLDATSYSNGVFTAETLSTFTSAMVRLYKNGAVVDTINKVPTEGSRVSINVTVDDTWETCFIGYRMGGANNIGGLFNKPIVADGTYTVSFMADKLPSTSVYGKFSNIQFESGSTATDYSPYSNICPISGHTECVTEVSGVNVWDEEWELGYYSPPSGTKSNSPSCIRSTNFIKVVPNESYYLKAPNNTSVHLCLYDANKGFLSHASLGNDVVTTLPNNAEYATFFMSDSYGATYNHDISINYPSTDHDYHAYNGTTYTTTLGRTVYGGTLDVVSGEMVVTHGMYVMNGTESYTQTSTGLFRFAPTPTMASGRWYTDDGAISDSYRKAELTSDVADGEIVFGSGNNFIYVRDSRATTIAEFKELLADNNVTITYPLATPQTIQLTPQEVQLLLGTNNVWSDGEVTLTYSADIQRYIEKKLGTRTTLTMSRPMVQTETTETEETE